ncbi:MULTISPECIES: dihydrofolate reductase family protein [Microbacterium]|uniref:dihydrofolate reductase family protein n=1 Tax=Microbacterium TaxID=33882 RepID=UPI0020C07660|nr:MULTISPECIES: dihydrofolate reductase family protein [Microbacterium]MCK8478115.1 dihydrofolate reductase family protein [Microbacterium aurugineum]MCZ4301812.1 dihydrofolate reductase family protein [Microbacterium oxydans]UUE20309.1 dihydrofolate reductase family protein [Microbacterium sp. J1-1]
MGIIFSDLAVSADGYATGLNQTEERPFGDVDDSWLHNWMFDAYEENKAEVDAIVTSGATIMGRNMFGPVRGEWDRDWRGWWGPNPPYHNPVFVLTHHPHEPIEMEGGTTFHFITDGIERALGLARDAAGEQDISIAGGPRTVNQFLTAGLLDELRLHITPCIIGAGERVFEGVPPQRLERVSVRATSLVTHITYRRI